MKKEIVIYLEQGQLFDLIRDNLKLEKAEITIATLRSNKKKEFLVTNEKKVGSFCINENYILSEEDVKRIINLKLLETEYEVDSLYCENDYSSNIEVKLKEKENKLQNIVNATNTNQKVKKKGSIKNV